MQPSYVRQRLRFQLSSPVPANPSQPVHTTAWLHREWRPPRSLDDGRLPSPRAASTGETRKRCPPPPPPSSGNGDTSKPAPPTSTSDRFIFPCSSEKIRRVRIFSTI